MTALDKQKMQKIEDNFALLVDFLDRKLQKPKINLSEVPCYFYQGKDSKLEIMVFFNPGIAKVDLRMVKKEDREPFWECSYDLNGLSMTMFERAIDDLISKTNERE